jgi:DNA-binding SARP family transcriptional activator
MADLKANLFGKFNIQKEGSKIVGMEARKVQELLSYLLLFREHPHSRDFLCETLWSDQSTGSSRKYLRQALWRLQSAIQAGGFSTCLVLLNDNDWIQMNFVGNFWLDIEEFERIFNLMKGRKAADLSLHDFQMLENAANIYKGDLLEGWYSDWCIFERERFQTMHLLLLDKLVQYCELHEQYETGLSYGMEILRYDHSYERAHRQLMRLYFLTGNRTQALQQYKRCEMALRDDLGVEPSETTKQLYRQIRSDGVVHRSGINEIEIAKTSVRTNAGLLDMLDHIKELSDALSRLEQKIREDMRMLGDSNPSQS